MGVLSTVAQHGCPVEAYEVVAPKGHTTRATITAEPGALVVPRKTLDHLLLRHATASGARFEGGVTVQRVEPTATGVQVQTSQGHALHARVAIIATEIGRASCRERV